MNGKPLFYACCRVALLLLALAPAGLAQTARPAYGPVVTAYLTSVREQLDELADQLRQREISRADYALAQQRLLTLRRLVQLRAQQRRADVVPELQVLTSAEFGMVGLSQPPEPERLKPGEVFDESWRLLGIEKTRPVFYVFEKVEVQTATRERMVERQPARKFALEDVIETIAVPEARIPLAQEPAPASRPRIVKEPAPPAPDKP